MTLWKTISEAARNDPSGDALKIAQRLISKTKRDEFVRLLADEIAAAQRSMTASAEKEAFREGFHQPTTDRIAASVAFKALAGEIFALGNGLKVEWITATVEQHQERIEFLRKMRDGIDATIARHEEAVRLILEHNVSCLEDLGTEEAA